MSIVKKLIAAGDTLLVVVALAVGVGVLVRTVRPSRFAGGAAEPRPTRLATIPPTLTTGRLRLGPDSARVILVEFSDFECPACKQAQAGLHALLAQYPHELAIVYRHLPLSQHASAEAAAIASECAADQGRFAAYADLLFAHQADFASAPWKALATEAGIRDLPRFASCLVDQPARDRVWADAATATELGINATPTLILGSTVIAGLPDTLRNRLVAKAIAAARATP